jgi:hypothetical protein
VATFIGEKRHALSGGPIIPRDVRCPVCGHNMILQEPFSIPAGVFPAQPEAEPVAEVATA